MNFFEYLEYVSSGSAPLGERILVLGVGMGFVVGLIPLIVGLIAKKNKLAIWGFVSTLAAGSAIGFIGCAPVAVLFIWLMFKPKKDALLEAEEEDELKDIELDEDDLKDNEK